MNTSPPKLSLTRDEKTSDEDVKAFLHSRQRDSKGRVIAQNRELFIGLKFNLLTIIALSDNPLKLKCKCDCGSIKDIATASLKASKVRSCGCLQRKAVTKHGYSRSSEYHNYHTMINRCYNSSADNYEDYGGRGIKVCERWLESFTNFLYDMGHRPDGMTIDRLNSNGNYEPYNCKWSTPKEQSNNKTNNRFITFDGVTLTIAQWSERLGYNYNVIYYRLENGWSVEKTLTTPVKLYIL